MTPLRRIFLMRHGERLDQVLQSKNWTDLCFNKNGEYKRPDLNFPKSIPKCKNIKSIRDDCPLSRVGEFQTFLIGESFSDQRINIRHVFCSPALRCVQTCLSVLKGYGKPDLPVAIEPGLIDFISFLFLNDIPDLMSDTDIENLDMNVRSDYKKLFKLNQLNHEETFGQVVKRMYQSVNNAVEDTKDKDTGDILIVSHAPIMVCPMHNSAPIDFNPTMKELFALLPLVPVASVLELQMLVAPKNNQEFQYELDKWQVVGSTMPNFTHSDRKNFQWKLLNARIKEKISHL